MSNATRFVGRSSVLSLVVVALAAVTTVHAQSTWVGGTSDWGTAGNWDPSGVPAGNVTFTSAGNTSVYLGTAARTVSTITFNSTTSSTTLHDLPEGIIDGHHLPQAHRGEHDGGCGEPHNPRQRHRFRTQHY